MSEAKIGVVTLSHKVESLPMIMFMHIVGLVNYHHYYYCYYYYHHRVHYTSRIVKMIAHRLILAVIVTKGWI